MTAKGDLSEEPGEACARYPGNTISFNLGHFPERPHFNVRLVGSHCKALHWPKPQALLFTPLARVWETWALSLEYNVDVYIWKPHSKWTGKGNGRTEG